MKRTKIICLVILFALGFTMPLAAQSLGGGLSFWVPESLYLGRGGSVGIESALGSGVGFSDMITLPFGIAYNKVYGLLPEGTAIGSEPPPWFIADTLLGFVMVKVRLPIGRLYVDAFGGGAGVWNMTLVPLTGNIESEIAGAGQTVTFTETPTIEGGQFGWGWQAGGAIGAKIGPVSVDLNVTYRTVKTAATVSGDYYLIDTSGPAVSGPLSYGPESIFIRLAGFNVGIDVSFEM
ncbi:MAG: hypothetical protein KAU31_09900 [Spirochaetaceae bacterium]|nr:hypothetical protein [Spirochaetaceae bacterium]